MQKEKAKALFRKCATFAELAVEAGRESVVQILRTGSWDHPSYGTFSVTASDLDEFVRNFQENKRGVDLAVDVNHDYGHKAVGWIRTLYREGEALFSRVEWTDEGLDLIKSKAYRYFSPELFFSYRDEESGDVMRNVLIGGGITNRPFFKGMQALAMSEPEAPAADASRKSFYFYDSNPSMKRKFSEIAASLATAPTVNAAQLDEARLAFTELPEAEQNAATAELSAIEAKFSDDPATEETPAPEAPKAPEAPAPEAPAPEVPAAPAPEAPAPEAPAPAAPSEPLQASEDQKAALVFSATGLTMEQIKGMQSQLSELQRASKFAETQKKVASFVFSEANKNGTILPKASAKFSEFAAKLPDALAAEFFEIMSPGNFSRFSRVQFGEIGTEGAAMSFSVPESTPEGVSRESFVLDTVAKAFMSKESGLSYLDACVKAEKHVKANNLK